MRFHCVQHYRFALKRVSCLRKCTPRSLTISRNDAIHNTESCLLLYNFNLLKIPLLNLIFA
ncbi:hypothetical protein [Helicobacter rodentium]|uniref:hypothetical protein n=1 Tax=Helicobacter rodentium TaxID=59617 RepID=UPI00260F0A15|nr:hypothetical protein [Helicobacter rodentium]